MSRLLRLSLVVGAAVCLLACERKAPGPDSCLALTESWLGVRHEQALRDAALFDDFQTMMTQCLTQPFDRELVRCVTSGASKSGCRARFRQRSEQRLRYQLSR